MQIQKIKVEDELVRDLLRWDHNTGTYKGEIEVVLNGSKERLLISIEVEPIAREKSYFDEEDNVWKKSKRLVAMKVKKAYSYVVEV